MKQAKKRYFHKTPEFWKVLANESKPEVRSWWNIYGSLKHAELNIISVGRSTGKSHFSQMHLMKSRYYESSKEKIS